MTKCYAQNAIISTNSNLTEDKTSIETENPIEIKHIAEVRVKVVHHPQFSIYNENK